MRDTFRNRGHFCNYCRKIISSMITHGYGNFYKPDKVFEIETSFKIK